jgi:peptidoglycan/LPS O-acetylase OafA/YrhL
MVAIVLTVGAFFLTPEEYVDLGSSAFSSVGFVSNIKFWRGSGYFELGMRPLLHTWSLAVEEQFYIFFPLMLSMLFRLRNRSFWLSGVTYAILTGSFALAAVGVYLSPSATFFLIPTRAWELMVGAVLALDLLPRITRPVLAQGAAAIGCAFIAISIFEFDSHTQFPGIYALFPCLGAALIIHSARETGTLVSRILSTQLMVGMGLISYSLYLYHFPIFLFAERALLRPLTPQSILLCLVLTCACGFLSWAIVERPFRKPGQFSPKRIFLFGVLGSGLVSLAAVSVVASHGYPGRFTPSELAPLAASSDFDPSARRCINQPIPSAETLPDCSIGVDRTVVKRSFLVVGDSHAAAIAPAVNIAARLQKRSGTLIAYNACAPLVGVASGSLSWKDRQTCLARNRAFVVAARDPAISDVILVGYWGAHFDELASRMSKIEAARSFAKVFDVTLNQLAGKRVTIFLDVPRSRLSLPLIMWSDRRRGIVTANSVLASGSDDAAATIIRRVAAGRAEVIELSAPFCDLARGCRPEFNGKPILVDNNHISAGAARALVGPYLMSMHVLER